MRINLMNLSKSCFRRNVFYSDCTKEIFYFKNFYELAYVLFISFVGSFCSDLNIPTAKFSELTRDQKSYCSIFRYAPFKADDLL